MPDFDATTFLEAAEELLTVRNPPPPAYIRSAANRAYYSQYAYLRKRIVQKCGDCFRNPKTGKSSGKHYQLHDSCKKHGDPDVGLLGQGLEQLCNLRNTSDYTWDVAKEPPLTEVLTALKTATNVQKLIDQIKDVHLNDLYLRLKK